MTFPLSVLDLAPVGSGFGASEALRRSTALAQRAEELGYSRFWIAEHHNMPAIASTAPEVLIAHIAALTQTIRVGSGGVMLPNHSPLAVAERFAMLEALHPGRIDLGLGRAPGTDRMTAFALGMRGAERFPEEVNEIRAMLHGEAGRLSAVAGPQSAPELWVLGSSGDGARIAAVLGVGYAHAHHIGPGNTLGSVELYRREFRPSPALEEPRVLVALAAVAADTGEEAQRQAAPLGINIARLRGGTPSALLTAGRGRGDRPQPARPEDRRRLPPKRGDRRRRGSRRSTHRAARRRSCRRDDDHDDAARPRGTDAQL